LGLFKSALVFALLALGLQLPFTRVLFKLRLAL